MLIVAGCKPFSRSAQEGACRSGRCVWPSRTSKSPPVEVSFGTSSLVSAPLLYTCRRARGAPSVQALAQRRCRAAHATISRHSQGRLQGARADQGGIAELPC